LAVRQIADELASFGLNASANGNGFDAALNGPTFERGIINIHLVRRRRDHAAMIGIKDNQVRICAGLNRALLWKKAK